MTDEQPSLLSITGADLPSPVFTPRPGWGGRLSVWLRQNVYMFLFRLVILAALVWFIASLFGSPDVKTTASPTPTPQAESASIIVHSKPGQGLAELAGLALNQYLITSSVTLDPIEHLWATDRLWHATAEDFTNSGGAVSFSRGDIEAAIMQAKALTPSQRRNLAPYVK